jgi:hypothetical protein
MTKIGKVVLDLNQSAADEKNVLVVFKTLPNENRENWSKNQLFGEVD